MNKWCCFHLTYPWVVPTTRDSGSHNPIFSSGASLSNLSPQSPLNEQPVARNGKIAVNTSKTKAFDELDALGRSMLGLSAQKPSSRDSSDQNAPTVTDTSVRHIATTPLDNSVRSASQATSSLEHLVELTNLDLSLSAIQPHPTLTTPFAVFPRETSSEPGVQLALHYAGNRPAPSVRVFVAVITSRSSLPVTDVHVRFGLSKPLSIRQLAPSGNSLAAYSPFLPAGAINQIVLVSDPVSQVRRFFSFLPHMFIANIPSILRSVEL
ncbi:uncharacterized protein DEA37_0014582 [Paragonimus westermani]|uniref:GAE domain-containing protein n=1 Tax=Paragonimus westermani TaxID=34504 RepID=A0A5J4P0Q5_9TREM|nr:uncharacterized protein DEA37_0014582 [Paragonimus westermani]